MKKKISNKEIALNQINQIYAEASKIYDDIIIDKELSTYYINELYGKTLYLKEKLIETLEALQESSSQNEADMKKICIPAVWSVANIAITYLNPLIGIISLIAEARYIHKSLESEIKNAGKARNELNQIIQKIDSLKILLDNNDTFLRKRLDEQRTRKVSMLLSKPIQLGKVNYANDIIQNYISNGVLPQTISQDTKQTIINMLQKDLETKETDVIVLLNLAKEKVSSETMIRNLK